MKDAPYHQVASKAREVLIRGTSDVTEVVGQSLESTAEGAFDSAWNCWANALPDRVWKYVFGNTTELVEAKYLPWEGRHRKIDVVKQANRIRPVKDRKPLKPPSKKELQEIVRSGGWRQRMYKWSKKITDYDKVADQIAAGIAQGKTQDEIAKKIEKHVQAFGSSAKRIVRTEAARISNVMAEKTFERFDSIIEGYMRQAVLDDHTRPLHRQENGTIYWKNKEPLASTRPQLPDAPNCRCTYSPVLGEEVDKAVAPAPEKPTDKLVAYKILKNWPGVSKGTYYLPPGLSKAQARDLIKKHGLQPGGSVPLAPIPHVPTPPPPLTPVPKSVALKVETGGIVWNPVKTHSEAYAQAQEKLHIKGVFQSNSRVATTAFDEKSNVAMESIANCLNKCPKFKKYLEQTGVKLKELELKSSGLIDGDSNIYGLYTPYKNSIEVAMSLLDNYSDLHFGKWDVCSSVSGTTAHEYGHFVHYKLWVDPDKDKEWDDIIDNQLDAYTIKTKISAYAGTNRKETFAESFSAFTHKDYKPGMLPKPVEDYLNKHLVGDLAPKVAASVPAPTPISKPLPPPPTIAVLKPTSAPTPKPVGPTKIIGFKKNWPGVPKGLYEVPKGMTKAAAKEAIKNGSPLVKKVDETPAPTPTPPAPVIPKKPKVSVGINGPVK